MEIKVANGAKVLEVGAKREMDVKTFYLRTEVKPKIILTYDGFKTKPTINGKPVVVGQTVKRGEVIVG